jgi:predicted TIM-barrel fold metal-dependent hydrolase
VIDVHGHMGPWAGIYFPRARPEQMLRTMDAAGVRLLVFCHHAALFSPEVGNAANVEAVRRFPGRLRAWMAINPNHPDAVERDLAGFDEHRDVFVGLKLLADYHGLPWDDAAYAPAWRFAAERRLPVLGHTWAGSRCDGPEQVRKAAERYPQVPLLLGHSLHGAWREAIAIAQRFPNVYLELTAVLDDRGPLEWFVAEGLSERLLFGTDLPWFDPHHGIGAVLSAEITDPARHNILHRNAERLLAEAGVNLPK